jgi:transposase
MYLDYDALIAEPLHELERLEATHRNHPYCSRITMLRLLKDRTYRSQRKLAPVLGYSERQLNRWFDTYREGGLSALLERAHVGGSSERITPEALDALCDEMKQGRIDTLSRAQRFLEEHYGLHYTIGGLSALFKRKRIKLKTGRRLHVKASADEQEAFKKTVQA